MIKVLPKEVSDKIAAGEVIESPVSIVKELIENSIDAGATTITCEIIKGGKEEIRITDNGSGISSEEVETAFLRHATSKIEKTEDLKHLDTLGFRGEALTSIAAVSRTELITKTKDEITGTRLIIHGGAIISKESIGCPDGTTFIVRDLFYNVPARAKFMKSEAAEAGRIIDMMSRLAITRPDIRFTLISNGKNYFSTTGSGDLKSAIISVYKDREYKDLVEVNYPLAGSDKSSNEKGISIHGFVSRPSFTRTNRRSQFSFVNGRTIKNKSIDKGIDLGYKERLFEGRHPITFLFLEMSPETVDVNVHPNKKEVRFNDEIAVITAIEEAIKNAILSEKGVIKATDSFSLSEQKPLKNNSKTTDINDSVSVHNSNSEDESINNYSQLDLKSYLANLNRDNIDSSGIDLKDNNNSESYESTYKDNYDNNVNNVTNVNSDNKDNNILSFNANETYESYEPILKPFDFDDLVFGQTILGTYIIATDIDNMYLFDQHAAHERVNYEKFVNAYLSNKKESQILLTPITFDVPLEMTEDDEYWMGVLNEMGYSIDAFGEITYIIREIPVFMSLGEAEEFAKSFVDTYFEDVKTKNQIVIDKLITKACKSSIKAHDHIKEEEIKALIEDLKNCRNPFSCPHGRPTFIKFSKYDLEKMFKRVQ